MNKLAIVIAVQARWMLSAIFLYFLFRENQGNATRIFFVALMFHFELASLVINIRHWRKK